MAQRLADIAHRATVLGLVGLGAGAIIMGIQVHRDTLRRGRELADAMERQRQAVPQVSDDMRHEHAWAEAAQAALKSTTEEKKKPAPTS